MDEKKSGRNSWLRILGIIALIIVFLVLFDVELIIEYIRNTDWGYLILAMIVLLLSYLVMAVRLRYILGNRPPLGYTFHASNVANLMNLVTFIPVTLIKVFLMGQRKEVDIPQGTSGVTLGISFDFIFKIISLLGVILLMRRNTSISQFVIIGGAVIILILGLLLLLKAKSETIINKGAPLLGRFPFITQEQAHNAITSFMEGLGRIGSPIDMSIVMLWTLLGWLGSLVFYFLGLLAIGIELPADSMIAGILLATFLVNPLSPYLPGVFHGLLVTAFYIVTRSDVDYFVALAVVLHAAMLVFWFSLGILGLRKLKLSFSSFREQITASVQQMRTETAD